MHRLAALPGVDDGQDGALLVEQEPAPVLVLTTSDTDLATMAVVLERSSRPCPVRGLNVAALNHPSVVDHYLRTTVATARVVLLRLLGGRSVWSYGLERLQEWQAAGGCLVVLDGVAPDPELESLGSTSPELTRALGDALRWGGPDNLAAVVTTLQDLATGAEPQLPRPAPLPDPLPHDWRQDDQGPAVGVLFYRALAQAGDLALVDATVASLRTAGLAPKALLISGLRTPGIQSGIVALWRRQRVKLVLTTTGFAAAGAAEDAATLWDELDCPVLQTVCSSGSRKAWQQSSVGLGPRDLGMQVVLPELDGRLLGRVVSFKEVQQRHPQLDCPLFRYTPVEERLTWCGQWARAWLRLAATPPDRRRLAVVLANYPTRNSHLANGVGLDTPASVAACLGWLAAAGYGVVGELPGNGDQLIHKLTLGRSNDPR
ncbi:MAG: cobaltochelatase subunit CobN, partial [Cyanobacteria bacterium MAG APA_bin_95]|nr:cobaltochelatase subunit CobN [Cyanobacteria bacterium MAG APA_bin_95]